MLTLYNTKNWGTAVPEAEALLWRSSDKRLVLTLADDFTLIPYRNPAEGIDVAFTIICYNQLNVPQGVFMQMYFSCNSHDRGVAAPHQWDQINYNNEGNIVSIPADDDGWSGSTLVHILQGMLHSPKVDEYLRDCARQQTSIAVYALTTSPFEAQRQHFQHVYNDPMRALTFYDVFGDHLVLYRVYVKQIADTAYEVTAVLHMDDMTLVDAKEEGDMNNTE